MDTKEKRQQKIQKQIGIYLLFCLFFFCLISPVQAADSTQHVNDLLKKTTPWGSAKLSMKVSETVDFNQLKNYLAKHAAKDFTKDDHFEYFLKQAKKHQMNPIIALAQIKMESNFGLAKNSTAYLYPNSYNYANITGTINDKTIASNNHRWLEFGSFQKGIDGYFTYMDQYLLNKKEQFGVAYDIDNLAGMLGIYAPSNDSNNQVSYIKQIQSFCEKFGQRLETSSQNTSDQTTNLKTESKEKEYSNLHKYFTPYAYLHRSQGGERQNLLNVSSSEASSFISDHSDQSFELAVFLKNLLLFIVLALLIIKVLVYELSQLSIGQKLSSLSDKKVFSFLLQSRLSFYAQSLCLLISVLFLVSNLFFALCYQCLNKLATLL